MPAATPRSEALRFAYPARLTKGPDGRLTVSFRDLPDALTDGADRDEALFEAADCLDEAIAGRINRREPMPEASALRRGEVEVAVPAVMAAKAAICETARRAGLTKAGLARALGCDEKEARRLLDPKYPTKLARLTDALTRLSSSLVLELATPLPAPDPAHTAAQVRAALETAGYSLVVDDGMSVVYRGSSNPVGKVVVATPAKRKRAPAKRSPGRTGKSA